jgi:hypothetical protein
MITYALCFVVATLYAIRIFFSLQAYRHNFVFVAMGISNDDKSDR